MSPASTLKVWLVPGVLEPVEHAEKTWGVRVPAQRSEPETAVPPAGIWGTAGSGSRLSLLGVRSQTGRQGQLAGVVRDPRHQAHKSPNPAFCGPGAEKLWAGRREIQVPTLRVRRQELAVWP